MELKGLLLGLFFSLGIFAVKSGVGVASGIVGQRPAQTRGDAGTGGGAHPGAGSRARWTTNNTFCDKETTPCN